MRFLRQSMIGLFLASVTLGLLVWALAGRHFSSPDNLLAGLGIGAIITAMCMTMCIENMTRPYTPGAPLVA